MPPTPPPLRCFGGPEEKIAALVTSDGPPLHRPTSRRTATPLAGRQCYEVSATSVPPPIRVHSRPFAVNPLPRFSPCLRVSVVNLPAFPEATPPPSPADPHNPNDAAGAKDAAA